MSITRTPGSIKLLKVILKRLEAEKPVMIIAEGHPAPEATVQAVAEIKKPLSEILTLFE